MKAANLMLSDNKPFSVRSNGAWNGSQELMKKVNYIREHNNTKSEDACTHTGWGNGGGSCTWTGWSS